ncbi:hypothetical protein [Streptomyces prunicolor]|uniref:hypothetical protein n=1 Tax=Streptomyces prunicolor TaxID=67348 RepID=UPI00035C34CA|nr:hypothetical protein [Streptomyces prunicolor]
MILIEVFALAGVLDPAEHHSVGKRPIDAPVGSEESHAEAVMDAGRALTQVLIHEPAAGITGDRHPADSADPPRWTDRTPGRYVNDLIFERSGYFPYLAGLGDSQQCLPITQKRACGYGEGGAPAWVRPLRY